MARFGLIDSDSDEDIPVQNVTKSAHQPKELAQATSSAKGKQRATSPPMDLEELRESPRPQKKPAANALVEDESGAPIFAHEMRSRRRLREESVEADGMDVEQGEEVEEIEVSRRNPAPWPAQVGIEPHRMHVMQTSFFRMPEEQAALKGTTETLRPPPGKLKAKQQTEKLLSTSAKLRRKHSRGSEGGMEGESRVEKSKVGFTY